RPCKNFQLPKIHDAAQIGVAILNSRDVNDIESSQLFRPDVHAFRGRPAKVADRRAEHVNVRCIFGASADGIEAGLLRDLQRIAQRHHRSVYGIVWNKDSGEILVAICSPLEWTPQSIAAANALDSQARNKSWKNVETALGGGVIVVVDTSDGVGSRCHLVAESGGPCERGKSLSSLIHNRSFHIQYVSVIEAESLADDQILIGILESDRVRSGELTFFLCYIQRRALLATQSLIVSPQRERITIFRRHRRVHQVQPPVLCLVLKLFKNPRFHLRAAIGESYFIEIVLNHGFSVS